MADFFNPNNKHWNVLDGIRSILGLTAESKFTLRLVEVEDSGEEYFCGDRKWPGWDIVIRELTEVTNDGVRLRVSTGTGEAADLYTCANRELQRLGNGDLERLAQRWVGKGIDGKPLLRLDILTA